MEKEAKCEKRKAALVQVGVVDSEIETTLAKFDSMSDDAFDHMVAFFDFKKKDKDKEDKKIKADEDAAIAKKAADEKAKKDKAAADAAALDHVEEDSVPDKSEQNDDDTNTTRTSASEWFGSSVLKSTAKLNKDKK